MSIFEIKNLKYSYPNSSKADLQIDEFKIDEGEFVLVLGDSGSGKSTFGRVFSGIVPKFFGGSFQSEQLEGAPSAMVFQDPERQLVMDKVEREIAFPMENMSVKSGEMKRNVAEILSCLDLVSIMDQKTVNLSGGQKQKVAIGSAIATGKRFLVLDEITSQLDPKSASQVISILKNLNRDYGYTILLIEQRIESAFNEADRIVFMKEGGIVFDGDREDFCMSPFSNQGFLPENVEFFSKLGIQKVFDIRSGRRILTSGELDIRVEKKGEKPELGKLVLKVDKLSFSYDNKAFAVRKANLELRRGEGLCIVGPNGSGKSTLVKLISGIMKGSGSIKLDGQIAYLSQEPSDYLFNDTVEQELLFSQMQKGVHDLLKLEKTLKDLDIYELKDKNPRDLSGGQKQRVAIATLLVNDPDIVIMDEPTRGLDPILKSRLGDIINRLKEQGKSIILISHDMEFASRYMDNISLMFSGTLMKTESKEEFFTKSLFYSTAMSRLFTGIVDGVYSLENIEARTLNQKEVI